MFPSVSDPVPYNIRPDAFAGTARYYARFRLPYPATMIHDLCRRAGVSHAMRLLDLGCGPGRSTIPLARRFREVVAVYLEAEMSEVGREEAERAGVANIQWRVGRAEDARFPDGWFEMITMGEAFHRFDQPAILKKAFDWLRPSGHVVTLGTVNAWTGDQPWQRILKEVRARYQPSGAAAGHPTAPTPDANLRYGEMEAMQRAGFESLGKYEFEVAHVWTVEALIGNAYTSSAMSKRALGDRAAAFETDLRRTL